MIKIDMYYLHKFPIANMKFCDRDPIKVSIYNLNYRPTVTIVTINWYFINL